MLALIQHGTYLEKWKGQNVGNSGIVPHLCKCPCQHEWKETRRPPTPRSGEHEAECTKCGRKIVYDTDD